MKMGEGIYVALRSLRANLLRSVLTMLGIIIGIASLIVTIAVTDGARTEVVERLSTMGSNLLMVKSGTARKGVARLQTGTLQSLTERDAEAIRREIPGVLLAAPLVLGPTQLVRKNRNWNTWTRGTEPDFFLAREWTIARGQHFTYQDVASGAKVAVLGMTVANALFPNENPIDKIIRIANVPFQVIGVLESKGSAPDGRNQDDAVFVPISTAKIRLFSENHRIDRGSVAYILVKMGEAELMDLGEQQIRGLLRQRHQIAAEIEDDFSINNWADSMAATIETSRTLGLLLGMLASISLVVGGISIMNIMFVSVTERTREIGLRLAVGASPWDIRSQFLIEAIMLCVLGGAVGVIGGVSVSLLFARVAHWPILIGADAIGLALGFAIIVGIVFGYYPALRASRLRPIIALHSN